MILNINLLAVGVSAIVSMVIGSIWYGPLFGKVYMKAVGMEQWSEVEREQMKKKMAVTYIVQFVASILTFFVLGWLIGALDERTVAGGLKIALIVWAGFVVPLKLGDAIWGGKMVLFWLGSGNMLLTVLAAGAVIGAWR